MWAWGANGSGQLGTASTIDSLVPVQVSGLAGAVAIAAGSTHSLAARGDGTGWGWGANGSGQLGNGSTTTSLVPVQASGLGSAVAVAAGSTHSLAVRSDATVRAWGANTFGQLGNGSTANSSVPITVSSLSNVQPVAKATYAYNGDGLRISKSVARLTTTFAWDLSGGLPMMLKENSTYYVYGPGGTPLERIDSSGAVTYHHQDQLGSTRLLTDDAGAVVATASYDSYGKTTSSTGSARTPLGYAGQYTDAETGFQYLRARYYDPATGQFLTRDPIEEITRSAYGYVGGDPLNKVDPSGLHPCDAGEQMMGPMNVDRSSRHCGLNPEQERQFLERERKAAKQAECDRREAEAAARAMAARARIIPHWKGLFRGVIEDEFFRAQAARAANMFYTTGKTTVQHIRDAGPAICQITHGRFCWQ